MSRSSSRRTIFRKRALQPGLPSEFAISGHSARVGSAVEPIEEGASLTAVRFAGGMAERGMVLQYGKNAMVGQGAMAQLRRARRIGKK